MAYFTNTLFYVDNTPTDRLWTCMIDSQRAPERARYRGIAILTAILEGDDVVVVVIAVATPACGCHKYASERKRGDYAHTLES